MNIETLVSAAHKNAKDKGFWDKEVNTCEQLMLVVSELGEAVEALRKGLLVTKGGVDSVKSSRGSDYKDKFETFVKDTFEDEIADAVIRLADMCGGMGIDLDFHIRAKMLYNEKRERLHGKKF